MISVGILFGGPSGEHEASIHTAGTVWTGLTELNLTELNMELAGIYMTPDRRLYYFDESSVTPTTFEQAILDRANMIEVSINLSFGQMSLAPIEESKVLTHSIDVLFPLILGTVGEDGSIQGLCRVFEIPCAGPTVLGGALSLDKALSKDVLRSHGILTCSHIVVGAEYDLANIVHRLGHGPYVVKPRAEGSSLGVSYAENLQQLARGIVAALEYGDQCIVEEYVEGIEIHCYAFKTKTDTLVSRVSGTKSPEKIYSHEQKMRSPLSVKRFVASDFSEQTNMRVREITEKCYQLLAGKGLARLDYFLANDGRLLFNELNSIPTGLGPVTGANPWIDYGLTRVNIIRKLIEDVI